MKLVKTLALGTVLTLGLQHGAVAAEAAQSASRMEEIVVVATRLPPAAERKMEEIVVVASRLPAAPMEEVVVVAKRIRPSLHAAEIRNGIAMNDFSASGCACLGELGQIAVRAPSL